MHRRGGQRRLTQIEQPALLTCLRLSASLCFFRSRGRLSSCESLKLHRAGAGAGVSRAAGVGKVAWRRRGGRVLRESSDCHIQHRHECPAKRYVQNEEFLNVCVASSHCPQRRGLGRRDGLVGGTLMRARQGAHRRGSIFVDSRRVQPGHLSLPISHHHLTNASRHSPASQYQKVTNGDVDNALALTSRRPVGVR